MRPERPREQEFFRTPAGWHENPCELGSGIRAKRESEAELPPRANDLQDDRGISTNGC